jgi:hypothetical protein
MEAPFLQRPPALAAAALALLLPFAVPLAAHAQGGPGVARIAYARGGIAVQRGDSSSPTSAIVNAPLEPGDYVTTGNSGRGEVAFDGGSYIRLGGDVQMRMVNITPGSREVQLAQGTIDLRAIRGRDLNDQIDTPSVSIRPHGFGSVRVNVDSHGVTHVTARDGSADVITPGGTHTIGVGETLLAQGPSASPSISTTGALAYDSFDAFDNSRDQYEEAPAIATSDPYVNQDIVGVDDLGPYGQWQDDPTYGEVWIPQDEPADWAPYQDGQWVWEDGYGWTWVSSDPWGWAPYHYGSWYHSHWGWAWYPPRPGYEDPTWEPAMVAFVGFGGGVGVSLDFGDPNFDMGLDIGWIPLAPYEPYYPWWGANGYDSIAYVNSYNSYQNYAYGSYVSGRNFYGGRFGRASRVSSGMYRNAHVFQGATPFVPTAANTRYGGGAVPRSLAVRTSAFSGRHYAGDPRVAARTPFNAQRTAAARVSRDPARAVSARTFTTRTAAARTAAARTGAIHMANRPATAAGNRGVANRAAANRGTANRGVANRAATANRGAANRGVANRGTANRGTANRATANRGRAANPAWARFNNTRGTHVAAGAGARGAARPAANVAHRATAAGARTANVAHRATAARPAANVARRATAARPATVGRAATHAAPAARSYARTYSAPRTTAARTYSAPARTYAAPHYAAPARTYAAPARTYAAPARTYAAPHYAAPARTYAAPARTYAAPHYAAPAAPHFAAPAARPAMAAPRAAAPVARPAPAAAAARGAQQRPPR